MDMNVLDAAYHAAHSYPGGASALARRMGKNPATLLHELTAFGTAKLGLCDAVTVSHFTGTTAIAQAFAAAHGGVFVPLKVADDGGSLEGMAAAVKEFGDVATAYASAMADNRVSPNELKRVEREALEAIAAIQSLVAHARATHEAAHKGRGV